MTNQLSDVDRRRIALLQQEVYLTNDIEQRKREAEVFDRERQGSVEQLIAFLAELLLGAKSELNRLQQVRDIAYFQMAVKNEEVNRTMITLAQLEEELLDFTEQQAAPAELTAAFTQAQYKIAEARTKLVEQQQTETRALEGADTEIMLLENNVSRYDSDILELQQELTPFLLEDLREQTGEETTLLEDESQAAPNEMLGSSTDETESVSQSPNRESELITDAEFEPILDEASDTGPRVNTSLEVVGVDGSVSDVPA